MADIKIPLELPQEEAMALAILIKRLTYDQITKAVRKEQTYMSGRQPEDVIWSAVRMLGRQLTEAGIC